MALVALFACGGSEPEKQEGSGGTDGELAACETERDSALADLSAAEAALEAAESDADAAQAALDACTASQSACATDLAGAEAELATCAADLGTAQSDLATCDADLLTCDADLLTCDGDLAACDGSLLTCQGDLATANQDLAACETERDDLQAMLDAVTLYDQDLTDYLGGTPGRAWVGWEVATGGDSAEGHLLHFLPDGTVFWGYQPGGLGDSFWVAETWSVSGNVVTVGAQDWTFAGGSLLSNTLRLQPAAGSWLEIQEAGDAAAVGPWTACSASDTYGTGCLVDDGSGGATPMSLGWTHSSAAFTKIVPFVRRAWSPTGASNANWSSSAGSQLIDQSSAGNSLWVQLPANVGSQMTVDVDNAGADGEVIADVVVFIDEVENF